MEKLDNKRIICIVLGALLIIAFSVKYFLDYKNDKNVNLTKDEIKFKEEYESLNGTLNSNNKEYLSIKVKDNNNVIYKSDDDINEVLEKGTGVIYFGFKSCPWCRSIIEVLLDSAEKESVKDIYYVDVLDVRSLYEVKNKKLSLTKKGTDGYYKILEHLDKYLTPYKLTVDEKEYDTGEKRLYAPSVVAVKNGEIVGFHEGTVDTQEDSYAGLNDTEKTELARIFSEIFGKISDATCKDKTGC